MIHLPLPLLKLIAILRFVIHEYAWRSRMWIYGRLLGKRHGKIFNDLRTQGYSRIPNYFSEEEMLIFDTQGKAALRESANYGDLDVHDKEGGMGVMRKPGHIKIRHIDKKFPVLRRLSRDPYHILINVLFCLKFKFPSVMYFITHDGSFKDPSVPAKTGDDDAPAKFGAGYWHIDLWRHTLKFFTPLKDIKLENGPTEIIPGSSGIQWDCLVNYFDKYYSTDKSKKPLYLKKVQRERSIVAFDEALVEKKRAQLDTAFFTANRGDLIIFDSRSLHRATNIQKGDRHIMWFYY